MSNATLLELVDRVEKASGSDGNLEAEIWLAVTPDATRHKWSYTHKATGRVCDVDETRDKFGHFVSVPRYMESLDAAMTLVPNGMEIELTNLYGVGRASVGLNVEGGLWHGEDVCGGMVLALTAAALRARAQQESSDAGQ